MIELSETKKWLIVAGLSMGPAMANGFARFAYALWSSPDSAVNWACKKAV